jgi:hypothetical protein
MINLSDLNKKLHNGKEVNDWSNSVNKIIKFNRYGIIGEFKIQSYDKQNQTLLMLYNNKQVKIRTPHLLQGRIKSIIGEINHKYLYEIGEELKDKKRNIIITNRFINYKKYYSYKCNLCGFDSKEKTITEWQLKNGIGCSCCKGKTLELGLNDIYTLDKEISNLFLHEDDSKKYTKSSGKKALFKCPKCHRIHSMTVAYVSKKRRIPCGCSDGFSYPAKFMFYLLNILDVNFKTEYSPTWIYPKRYDFYFELTDSRYIIEMDGGWHKKDNNLSGISKEESYKVDAYKDSKAIENGIVIIRIDCEKSEFDFIKNNVEKSSLGNIFDFNNINWREIESKSLNNLVYDVCIHYSKNKTSTTELSDIFNIDVSTIIKYLHIGHKLDWCEYNPKHKNSKKIELYKDDRLQFYFESIVECILFFKSKSIKFTRHSIDKYKNSETVYNGFLIKI